jgi:hypothetical protein
MIIDSHPPKSPQQIEPDSALQLPHDMEDPSQFLDKENIFATLDDETIVQRFARGKKRLVSNHNLRIDYAHNSLQLSTVKGDLIAIHKVAERLHYILVKKDDEYADLIHTAITEHQFIPIDNTTVDRRFVRYQKYEIPEGYLLQYEPASVLWQTWQDNQNQFVVGLRLDIMILAKSKWYRVQEMLCIDDRLDLQTRLGLISFLLKDRIAWIAKLESLPTVPHPHSVRATKSDRSTTADLQGLNSPDSEILAKIISKLAIDSSITGDLEFNPEDTMSASLLNQSPDSSLLYDQDRSSALTESHRSPIEDGLLGATLKVLEAYLEHGETIVRTEVVTDAQGNTISEKTVTTQRSCPRWAIEAILKLD